MRFYSTFIGEEKVVFAWAGDIAVRVSDSLWAIGEGRPLNPFFVRNLTIDEQAKNPHVHCQPVFYTQFLVEGFSISQFIKQIWPFSFQF